MSIWEQLYREYRRRERDGTWKGGPPGVGKTDLQRRRNEPFDDVYHAALCMIYSTRNGSLRWAESPDRCRLFRGQRAEWAIMPSLFRGPRDEAAIAEEIARTTVLVRRIQRSLAQASETQAVALAQHYSLEAGVRTWMIDTTWDPFVALHFASADGAAGEIGMVTSVKPGDWSDASLLASEAVAPLHVVEVPGAARMASQRAVALSTTHPDMFEHCVAHVIRFRQRPGLVFRDDKMEPPITRASFFPTDDPLASLVAELPAPDGNTSVLASAPANVAHGPFRAADYLRIVEGWWRKEGWPLDEDTLPLVTVICEFHERLQDMRDDVDIRLRSLYRLRNATASIHLSRTLGNPPTLEEVLDCTLSDVPIADPQYPLLRRTLGEIHRQVAH